MRDKNNLSHAETPVFIRVSRDYVRDEGIFVKTCACVKPPNNWGKRRRFVTNGTIGTGIFIIFAAEI